MKTATQGLTDQWIPKTVNYARWIWYDTSNRDPDETVWCRGRTGE